MQRKNILRKTFVTSDKWKGAARRVKIRTQVRNPLTESRRLVFWVIIWLEIFLAAIPFFFIFIWTNFKRFKTTSVHSEWNVPRQARHSLTDTSASCMVNGSFKDYPSSKTPSWHDSEGCSDLKTHEAELPTNISLKKAVFAAFSFISDSSFFSTFFRHVV